MMQQPVRQATFRLLAVASLYASNLACSSSDAFVLAGEKDDASTVLPSADSCDASASASDCSSHSDNVNDGAGKCVPGSTSTCDSHAGKDGIGICRSGARTCVTENGTYGACLGSVAPRAEDCEATGEDNDCNGIRGDGAGCTKWIRVYEYETGTGGGCTTKSIFVNDTENPSPMPSTSNGPIPFREFTTFRLFREPGPNKIAIQRCDTGPYGHQIGTGTGCTVLGYASTVPGGNGWAELVWIFTSLSSEGPEATGLVTLPLPPLCCGCVQVQWPGPRIYTLR